MRTEFGDLLQGILWRREISHSELARRIDGNYSTISRLASGSRAPSREMVLKIAEGLDLSERERIELMASAGYLDRSISVERLMILTDDNGLGQSVVVALDALAEVERRVRGLTMVGG